MGYKTYFNGETRPAIPITLSHLVRCTARLTGFICVSAKNMPSRLSMLLLCNHQFPLSYILDKKRNWTVFFFFCHFMSFEKFDYMYYRLVFIALVYVHHTLLFSTQLIFQNHLYATKTHYVKIRPQRHWSNKNCVNFFINFTDFNVKLVHFLSIQKFLMFSIFPFSVNGPLSF